jgi:hypothetical protein
MTTSKKLKIWTIVTHALIVVGFGHGILCFAVIEILWFPYFTKGPFSFMLDSSFQARLNVVGLMTLLGQAMLIFSILNKRQEFKVIFHKIGLILFWLSIMYFNYSIEKSQNIYFATITCIPFFICSLIALVGLYTKHANNSMLDK